MKKFSRVLAIAAIAGTISAPVFAGQTYKLEFYSDQSRLHIGTDTYQHHNDFRHHDDLYVREGFTSTGAANCHRHVDRAGNMRYHSRTECHRHNPWLHPSLDYGIR